MKSERDFIIENEYTYSLNNIICKGNNSEIFYGNKINTDIQFAFKTEDTFSKTPELDHEKMIITSLSNCKNIPKIYKSSVNGTKKIMIMDLLGHNLEQIFSLTNYKFNYSTSLLFIVQILDVITELHSNHIIHRDLRPEHFLFDKKSSSDIIKPALDDKRPFELNPLSKLYLIDFGISKLFQDPITKKHISFKKNKKLKGSKIFSSIWSHLGAEQSRRDDLDSIGLMMIYFLKGNLPWQNIKAKTKKEIINIIAEKKLSISPMELCKDIPFEECLKIIHYIRGLQFEETPQYDFIKKMLQSALNKVGYDYNNKKSYYIFCNQEPIGGLAITFGKKEDDNQKDSIQKSGYHYSVKKINKNIIKI